MRCALSHSTDATGENACAADAPHHGFTLIELILVMTILTIAISIAAPSLSNFFRGRSMDSEGRRLLALTRQGQSRAASEGVPMELSLDSRAGLLTLEADPTYQPDDSRKIELTLPADLELETVNTNSTVSANFGMDDFMPRSTVTASTTDRRPDVPRIRFLPDGSISLSSPQYVRLVGKDGTSIGIAQSRNGLGYEISGR